MNNLFQEPIYRPSQVTFSCAKSTIETLLLWTYFTPFPIVSIVDFEQVSVSWNDDFKDNDLTCGITSHVTNRFISMVRLIEKTQDSNLKIPIQQTCDLVSYISFDRKHLWPISIIEELLHSVGKTSIFVIAFNKQNHL